MTARVRHDDFLRRLSTGDLDPGSDEARRHFAECQSCRERWREMARLIEELEGADVERREVLTHASEPSARDIERARRAAVSAGIASPPAATGGPTERRVSPGSRRNTVLWLAAAALLCAAFFVVRAWTAQRAPIDLDQQLGSSDASDFSIAGERRVLDENGFDIQYSGGQWPRFRIELEGRNPAGDFVTKTVTIDGQHFRPAAKLLESFTGPVLVRVQPLDLSGWEAAAPFEVGFSRSP